MCYKKRSLRLWFGFDLVVIKLYVDIMPVFGNAGDPKESFYIGPMEKPLMELFSNQWPAEGILSLILHPIAKLAQCFRLMKLMILVAGTR